MSFIADYDGLFLASGDYRTGLSEASYQPS